MRYLFSLYLLPKGPVRPFFLALRDDVGASCRSLAWMAWSESIGMGSSIIDLLYDESIHLAASATTWSLAAHRRRRVQAGP